MDRNEFNEPWVSGVYETGRTKPPKRRGGCCAAVLIVFIFLFGLLSLLSVLGVRLFKQIQEVVSEPEQYALEVSEIPTEEVTEPLATEPQLQDEEIALLHESREQQQSFIALLLDQLEKKDRRMDEKDEIIRRFMVGELTVSKADSAR